MAIYHVHSPLAETPSVSVISTFILLFAWVFPAIFDGCACVCGSNAAQANRVEAKIKYDIIRLGNNII